MAESSIPDDWFAQGDLDIQAASVLLDQGGPFKRFTSGFGIIPQAKTVDT
jgi:hypothetical protein